MVWKKHIVLPNNLCATSFHLKIFFSERCNKYDETLRLCSIEHTRSYARDICVPLGYLTDLEITKLIIFLVYIRVILFFSFHNTSFLLFLTIFIKLMIYCNVSTYTSLIWIDCCLKNLRDKFTWKCLHYLLASILEENLLAVVRWKVFFGRLPFFVWFRSANSHINIIF